MALNKWIGMGRLARDPELRRTGNGTAVTSFTIAVDRDRKPKDGERETDFVDVVAWRQTAEFVSKYFEKGRMAVVEGRLQFREYTDRDGNKRKATEIIVENAYFGDSKKTDSGTRYQSNGFGGESDFTTGAGDGFGELPDVESELPF